MKPRFSVEFEKKHSDVISGKSMQGTSVYWINLADQGELPNIIAELNAKGYTLRNIKRDGSRE